MRKNRGRRMYKRKGRKGKARKPTVNVNRALAPVAQRYITKLKFAADVATGADGFVRINLNSIWDPLRSGAPSPDQPYGRDQLAILYNRYRVISCGWRFATPNAGTPLQIAALPSNETYTTTAFADIRENPRAKYVTQHPTGNCYVMTGKTYLPSLVGRTKSQYMADDRYQASINSNPAELAVLNIGVAVSNGQMVSNGQIINLLLEYTVEFFDVISLGPS